MTVTADLPIDPDLKAALLEVEERVATLYEFAKAAYEAKDAERFERNFELHREASAHLNRLQREALQELDARRKELERWLEAAGVVPITKRSA